MVDPDGGDQESASNRFWGGMRMLGGAAQTVAGAFVFIQVEVPVAAQVVGGIAMVNGVDDFATGWRQLVSGREERGAIQTAATATAGLVTDNKAKAKAFGDGVSMGFGFVSPTGPMTGGPRVVPALARVTTGEVVVASRVVDGSRVLDHARSAQITSHSATVLMSGALPDGQPSASSTEGGTSGANASHVPDEYFDDAMARIDEGGFSSAGAHLTDLTNHAQSRAARAERGLAAPLAESAHTSARSAMKNVPGYNPRASITRLLDAARHRGFDDYWKRVFRQMANASGETQISVRDYWNIMRDAIGANPHFSTEEANSMVELLRDELYVQHGLRDTDRLRLPYSP